MFHEIIAFYKFIFVFLLTTEKRPRLFWQAVFTRIGSIALLAVPLVRSSQGQRPGEARGPQSHST